MHLLSSSGFSLGGVERGDENSGGCARGILEAIVNDKALAQNDQGEYPDDAHAEQVGDAALQARLVNILHLMLKGFLIIEHGPRNMHWGQHDMWRLCQGETLFKSAGRNG